MPELIRNGRAPLPGIGFVPLPEEVATRYGLRGVVVQSVRPGSSAARAGLQGIDERGRLGDVIVAVDGKPVATLADLALALERIGIGNTVRLTVLRNNAASRWTCWWSTSAEPLNRRVSRRGRGLTARQACRAKHRPRLGSARLV